MHEMPTSSRGVFTVAWLRGAVENALVAFAATFLSEVVGSTAFNALRANWVGLLGVALGAAVLSVAKSVASAPAGDQGTNFMIRGSR